MLGFRCKDFEIARAIRLVPKPARGSRRHLSEISFLPFCGSGVVQQPPAGCAVLLHSGERDAKRLRLCDPVARHHDGPRPNRDATDRSDRQQRNCRWVGNNVFATIGVITVVRIAGRRIVGIVDGDRIGERCRGCNGFRRSHRLRPGDGLSSTLAAAGGNTGHLYTGGEHDGDGPQFSLAGLPASGSRNGWRLGQPERDRRRVARRMLRVCVKITG
jgi:hypothetical protein